MNVRARIDRLHRTWPAEGCRDCHWWGRSRPICDDKGACTRPERCPTCGRVVPIVNAKVIVGTDLELI